MTTPSIEPVVGHDGQESLPAETRVILEIGVDVGDRAARSHARHDRLHHVADEQRLERLDRVLAQDVEASARHLLGQDRSREREHADEVRGHGDDQQRQQQIHVVRQLDREDHGGERRPHDPRHHGREAEDGPRAFGSAGQDVPRECSERGAHHQDRREDPAARSRSQRDRPDHALDDQDRDERADSEPAAEHRRDRVVSDAERPRLDQSPDPDHEPSRERPPRPVDRQQRERVLGAVDGLGQHPGGGAADHPERDRRHQRRVPAEVDVGHREQRSMRHPSVLHERHPQRGGRHAGARHDDHRSGLPLEQQELHRERDGGERRPEDGAHPARRPGDEQRPALDGAQVEELREDRSEGAAGQDDRTLRSERAARADADGARDRLQHHEPRLHLAPADQDGLHRLRDAVAADAFRAEPRHQPHDQAADHRDGHRDDAEPVRRRRHRGHGQSLVVGQVRDQRDQADQHQGEEGAEGADDDGGGQETEDLQRGREVAQPALGAALTQIGPEDVVVGPSAPGLRMCGLRHVARKHIVSRCIMTS